MPRTALTAPYAFVALACVLSAAGCNTGSREEPAAATAGVTQTPGSVNVLPGSSAGTSGTTTAGTSTPAPAGVAAASSASSAAAGSSAVASAASASVVAPAASAPAASTASAPSASAPAASATTVAGVTSAPAAQAQIWGTIPPDPTTGFEGTLYLAGERFVPGSIISVEVNGVWTKFLPATFHSSEVLGVYVHLTVAADYAFTAVAPDGSLSTPVTFTVPNGGVPALLGLTAPVLNMVYPPSVDTNYSGTLWLIGDQFMPGSVALVSVAGSFPVPMPLQFINDRTVGLSTATPFAGDITIQVSSPNFLSSQTVTLTVYNAATTPTLSAPLTPSFSAPSAVVSPFVGTVHLSGADFQQGATVEFREVGGGAITSTPLIRVSSVEAWWTLTYPTRGNYEVRVVNPGGAAAPWAAFRVD